MIADEIYCTMEMKPDQAEGNLVEKEGNKSS
jgi:hypothetical protein